MALLFLVVALTATALLTAHHQHTPQLPTQARRVEPGDTLWSLASAHPVPGLDTAQTVDLIAEINGIDAATLRAGSTVQLPLGGSDTNLTMR